MNSARRAFLVAQVFALVAGVVAFGMQALPAGAETVGPPVPATGTAVLGGVACPSATFCQAVGVGTGSNQDAVVSVINGNPGAATTFTDAALFSDVACPTTTTCVGTTGNFPPGGQVVLISNGTPAAPQTVSGTSFLLGVACPSASTCLAVGEGDGGGGVVVPIANGIAGPAQPVPSVTFALNGIACPTSTTCYAVGLNVGTSGVVVPIVNGVAGTVVAASGTGTLEGIACPTATTCEAVGQDFSGPSGVVVPLTSGTPGAAQTVAGTDILARVACPTPTVCEAVGSVSGGGGALVRIDGGTPGTAQAVPATSSLRDIACPTTTTCEAVGLAGSETPAQVGIVLTITFPVTPSLTTAASPSVPVGGRIRDTATLGGGASPSGTITFTLFRPGDTGCTAPVATSTLSVAGNGTYTSTDAIPDAPGTYRWVAAYGGDTSNDPAATACGDSGEQVVVTPQTLTGRAYGTAATVVTPWGQLKVPPTPDTGAISTTSTSTTSPPCVATGNGLETAHGLCVTVTTALRPSRSSATASALDATIRFPGLPTIVVTGLRASSQSTCSGSSGATTFAGLTIGGRPYPSTAPTPNTRVPLLGLPGAHLILNEQTPVAGGLTANGLHLHVVFDGVARADVVVASATSDIHNCP